MKLLKRQKKMIDIRPIKKKCVVAKKTFILLLFLVGILSNISDFRNSDDRNLLVNNFMQTEDFVNNPIPKINEISIGEILWSFNTGEDLFSKPAIGDIDNDGQNEIVYMSFYGLYCLESDGTSKWSIDYGTIRLSQPGLADVSGDGAQEVPTAEIGRAACRERV